MAAFPAIVPRSVLGGAAAPSNRIGVGVIGVGGRGHGAIVAGLKGLRDVEIRAVCDVNRQHLDRALATAGLGAREGTQDFREVIERKDIDVVAIATPDHWHVIPAIAAARAGKDIYCEKPLSNTVAEGRALVTAVRRYGVVFQHGTQLKSLSGTRRACELVRNGRIGELRRIVIGSPPGNVTGPVAPEPVPEGLDYDRWLGPAPWAPYCRQRVVPHGWYFISDYSKAGWIAGYGVHDVDIAQWGMGAEKTGPVEVEGTGVFPDDGLFDTVTTFDLEMRYANGVKLVMTDTGKNAHGVRFEGSDGWVFTRGGIQAEPSAILRYEPGLGDVQLYRSPGHLRDFIDCVKTRRDPVTPIEVAHRSTSACLIAGIALRLGRPLRWEPESERFADDPEANRLLSCPMRSPWRLGA